VNAAVSFFLSLTLSLFNQFSFSLENAFLQNNPNQLKKLLVSDGPVLLTLPEPFKFSDCFTPDQTFLILRKIFRQTTTLEFFIDQENPPVIAQPGAIIQARWSFVDREDGRKYLFRLYIYLRAEKSGPREVLNLRIKEIRAEKR
jgi:hypothetical protein